MTLMIAHSDRYSPVFRETRRLLDEGALGEVIALHVDHYSNYVNPPGGWRRSRDLIGGGCVMDTGIHQLDLLSWYLGMPAEVFAYAATDPARLESEVVCTAVFRFAGGAIAEFFCNWGAFRSPPARIRNNEGLSLFGTRGSVYVMDYETLVLASPTDDRRAPRTQELKVDNPGEWVVMWGHFIDCLRTGATPLSNGPEAKKAVQLVAAIYRSLATGAPVRLPPAE